MFHQLLQAYKVVDLVVVDDDDDDDKLPVTD